MIKKWTDVPLFFNITLERVECEALPTLLGRSASLDKRIADILSQTKSASPFWFFDDSLLEIDLNSQLMETDEIEVEVEGKSTGYFDPGRGCGPSEICYPPEEEDEREITEIKLLCYKDGDEIGSVKVEPENFSDYDAFELRLSEEDLPQQEPDYSDDDYE